MYKQANLSFSVAAQSFGDDVTSIQFSTQDKNTAKLVFVIKEGKQPLDLTDVEGLVDLVMGDKSVFDDNKATVTAPLDGKLEYTITPEQIRHSGRAKGELQLVSKDGQSIGGFRFNFTIKSALVDEYSGPVKEFYIQDLEAVKQEVQKKADTTLSDIDNIKAQIEETAESIKDIDVVRIDTELKTKVSKVNGKAPDSSGNVTIPVPEVDTTNLATKTELSTVTAALADTAKKSDLDATNANVSLKANKSELLNGLRPKDGVKTWAQLQSMTTGNTVGDYYYSSDGDGVNPPGNYRWTGTTWSFAGTGDEGYNKLKDNISTIESQFEFEFEFEPVNELPTDLVWKEKGYMYDANGNIVASSYAANTQALMTLLPVIPGHTYEFSRMQGNLFLYNSNKNGGKQYSNTASTPYRITIPTGYHYLGLNIDTASMGLYRLTYFNRLEPTDDEIKTSKFTMPNLIVSDNQPLKGKVIVNFGDSIFGNARPPSDISTKLANLTGATVHNCGFGGCRMGFHTQAIYDAFSMYRLAYSIANKDWSLQDSVISNTALPSYFAETLALLKTINFSNVNILTIEYGTNDFADGLQPSGADDENPTNRFKYYSGALKYSIETLLTAFPKLKIFLITPHYRFRMNTDGSFLDDSNTWQVTSWVGSGGNHTLVDFVEAGKDVAKRYQIPVIDNYFDLGINKFNRTLYFPSNDGVHHNQNGRDLIAEHIAKKIW